MTNSRSKVIVQTDRLLLRELAESDLAPLTLLYGDPQVMRFSLAGPLTFEQSRDRLAGELRCYREQGFGKWAVVLRDTRQFIGVCGVSMTAIEGPPEPEVGYRLMRPAWGKGYATEAVQAAVEHAFRGLGIPALRAFVHVENVNSARVLKKAGFGYQKDTVWHGHKVQVFGRTKHDACAAPKAFEADQARPTKPK